MNNLSLLNFLDHHAYFIHSVTDGVQKLKEYLKDTFNIHSHQNPDFFHEKFETLGIEDSRRIRELHLSKSFQAGSKKIFIIEANNITLEAQNALLKIFEEPHEDVHFFLIMPSSHVLLPTLKSRLFILQNGDEKKPEQNLVEKAEQFLKMNKKEKVDFVDEIAKAVSDDGLQKSDAQAFLAALEYVLYKKDGVEKSDGLKAILKAREYMNDRSPSIKQLLEFVALSL